MSIPVDKTEFAAWAKLSLAVLAQAAKDAVKKRQDVLEFLENDSCKLHCEVVGLDHTIYCKLINSLASGERVRKKAPGGKKKKEETIEVG